MMGGRGMEYLIYDMDLRLVAKGNNKEAVIKVVRTIFPEKTLIGVEKRPDGSEAGFFVGKVNF